MSSKVPPKNIATRSVRAGLESDAMHGSVVPPIYLSTNFAFECHGRPRQYDYTRSGNPTRDQLAGALADLEGGAGAVVTCTGMAAITLVLATLPNAARIIAPHDCYGGTYRLLAALHAKGSLLVDFIDQSNPRELQSSLAAGAKLVWIETPSNPLLRVVDIRAISEAAHAVGALAVVDNTFLSPVWQQPLSLGADLALHSTTKYLNGHSDVVGGAVIAASAELQQNLVWWANALGVTGAPFDSFLLLRGMKTLSLRLDRQQSNARKIAEWLNAQPAVERVYYPGLADEPQLRVHRAQASGDGAVLSFITGDAELSRAIVEATKLFNITVSFGGVNSTISLPNYMSHASIPQHLRQQKSIPADLVRVSVGAEDVEDLLDDLNQAFEFASQQNVGARAVAAD